MIWKTYLQPQVLEMTSFARGVFLLYTCIALHALVRFVFLLRFLEGVVIILQHFYLFITITSDVLIKIFHLIISISYMQFSRYMIDNRHGFRFRFASSQSRTCVLWNPPSTSSFVQAQSDVSVVFRMTYCLRGEYEIRTRDLLLARQALSQLS